MKRFYLGCIVAAITLSLCSWSCSSGGDDNDGKTPEVPANISVSQESLSLDYTAQTVKVTVTSNVEWGVSIDGAPDWVKVSPSGGLAGSSDVTFTLTENKGTDARSANVLFKAGSVRKQGTITQGYNTDSGIVVPDGYKLVWQDEFDSGSIPDTNEWWYETGGGGWGNNEVQTYVNQKTPGGTDLATIANGLLTISVVKENGSVYSIRMNTKKYWTYGWFEARLKVSDVAGAWPAYWMMPQNYTTWPGDGEIDIMEYAISTQGKDKVSSSIHCNAYNWPKGTQKTHVESISKAADEFHVYALEWSATEMNFYIDGKKHLTFKNEGTGYDVWPFNAPFYLKLNMAWGGNMGGTTADGNLPARYQIDYVRVFQKK